MNLSVPNNLSNVFNVTVNQTAQQRLWDRYARDLTIWYCVALFNSFSCGIINLIFFGSNILKRNRQTGPDILIGHLVAVETVHTLVNMPINVTAIFVHSQSIFTCRITHFFFAACNVTIFWTLFFLSVNRFVAIVIPFQYPKFTDMKFITLSIVSAWTISISLTIPLEFNVAGSFAIDRVWGGCVANPVLPGQFDYRNVQTGLGVYLPIAVACLLYIVLLGISWWNSRKVGIDGADIAPGAATGRTYRRKVRMSKMLFFSALLYCMFFFSIPILRLLPAPTLAAYPMLQNWVTTVYILGHAVHPVGDINSSLLYEGAVMIRA